MPSLLLFTDPQFQRHDTGPHPENAQRLIAIDEALQQLPTRDLPIAKGTPAVATQKQLLTVHTPGYLLHLEEVHAAGGGRLDPDTVMSAESLDVARLAAGTACKAVRLVAEGVAQRALCLSRPPGHHALADKAMGFCVFNNVAIAAKEAREECEINRILIIDWDVHHGNGTQDIFYADGQTVFYSIHRDRFWPGSGHTEETGTGRGLGATFNAPILFGTSREEYFKAFESRLQAAVKRARPELILLSAGFDAHRLDPVGSLGLETEDFARLTDLVTAAADAECGGRLVSLLEGGYHPQMLGESVRLHVERLIGV